MEKYGPTEMAMGKNLRLGWIFTVIGISLICIATSMMLGCPITPFHVIGIVIGLCFTAFGISLLIDGIKEYHLLKKMEADDRARVQTEHEAAVAKIQADKEAEIAKLNEEKERDRIKIFDPSTNQKRTFVVPVLADLSGGIYAGTLHTDVPIEVMGENLDFYRMIEGNPDPTMTVSGLPSNPGGVAGKAAGLSIRSGIMLSGLAHYANSFVVDKKDINVVVVIIYNAEITGISGQSVRITHDTSRYTLTPLDLDILKCEYVPLDVLEPKVFDALTRLVISKLPVYVSKNKP